MHFAKTYSQILQTLPPDLRDNAIQYRQLKKLINQVVLELSQHGLSPSVLHNLLNRPPTELSDHIICSDKQKSHPKAIYEFHVGSDCIEPRLRVWFAADPSVSSDEHTAHTQSHWSEAGQAIIAPDTAAAYAQEVVIPLISDGAFFQLLSSALRALAALLFTIQCDFMTRLHKLTEIIASASHPMSSTSFFHPYSSLSNPSSSLSHSMFSHTKNDLYAWREIFQLYLDSEIFESVRESNRGEVPVEESEQRLQRFIKQVNECGLSKGRRLKMKESRDALRTFIELNDLVLSIKKFQVITTEAIRKILKKHTKRTALPLPLSASELDTSASHISNSSFHNLLPISLASPNDSAFPRVLLQALTETLIPIIPHIDDYSCLICTSIAFKPIRLICGHLFCVRCLVKMQKRSNGNCPMCRSPSVLLANRTNIDWALLNLMQDWFPAEVKAKRKHNEKEAAEEELLEMGINPHQSCLVM